MKTTPGTLQEGGASFATTHWSVVAQAALTDVPEAADALAKLSETYWPPIYSFVRRRGYSPADAQDLTQSFFAFFLRTKAYARTDRLHGKFRSFLLASVKNFLSDNWDRDQAIRRGGGYQFVSLDQETAEAFYDASSASDSTAEHLFELRWAKALTSGALDSLRQELQTEGKLKLFEQLKNFLTGGTVIPFFVEVGLCSPLTKGKNPSRFRKNKIPFSLRAEFGLSFGMNGQQPTTWRLFRRSSVKIAAPSQLSPNCYKHPMGWMYSPAPITPAFLRLDLLWDPLRADPRFQELCQDKLDKSIAVQKAATR